MFLPDNIKILIEKLYNGGYDAYAVGGCVRDCIIGIPADDYDITTSAKPDEIKKVLSEYKIIDSGLQHGTLTVISGGSPIEITTHRIDGSYSDNRRPESVEFTDSVVEDLKRRDFTVNAIAYSHLTGITDPYNGVRDIKDKIIRCVGNADISFNQDALRILRAMRFSSVLNFSVADETAAAIHKNKSNINNLSLERIQKEFLKLLRGKNVFNTLMDFSDVIFEYIPELKDEYRHIQHGQKHAYDVWEHTCRTIENIDPSDEILRLTMLFHDIGKVPSETIKENGDSDFTNHAHIGAEICEKTLKRLKFNARTVAAVTFLVDNHDKKIPDTKPLVKRYLNYMGEDNFERFLKIRKADRAALAEPFRDISKELNRARKLSDEIKLNKECIKLADLDINGEILAEELNAEGSQIRDLLDSALNAVFDEKCPNEKNSILDYLKQNI